MLIDGRLYLPKEWASNPARCRKAGIPEAEHAHKSKSALALVMVACSLDNIRFMTFVVIARADGRPTARQVRRWWWSD
jgi:hypothetical protein